MPSGRSLFSSPTSSCPERGFELARYATSVTPDLEVVFITGYRDRAAPVGAFLLQKPFSPEALFRLVSEKLEAS